MQFTKLRLSGFKSFVDATDMEIGTGLTGIVGPNGCGKSNLVEALRWAMGETSYKRLRGSGMEDVIFNGTADRPARNIAEVILTLDNSERTATTFNDADQLEVVRRIERGEGSAYKVNGKPVRAKDVQLLFADTSIGAHSPALVSQGRIADIINAKPENRRKVLEEAAGISGLHVRRHEAELKLRAAEQNLTRLEDVMGAMEVQLSGLKKQARQASRYRNISGHIERQEALLFLLKWKTTQTQLQETKEAYDTTESLVREQTSTVTELTTKQTEQAEKLPALRRAETDALASLQRLRLGYEALEKEEERVIREKTEAEEQLAQIALDTEHEKTLRIDADKALEKLSREIDTIQAAQEGQEERARGIESERNAALECVGALDTEVTDITKDVAAREARKNALTARKEEYETRLVEVSKRLAELNNELDALSETSDVQDILDTAKEKISDAENTVQMAQMAISDAEASKDRIENAVQDQQDVYQTKQTQHAKLIAEAEALQSLLASNDETYEPVLNTINVPSGLEAALATALGEGLDASLNNSAPKHWRDMPELALAISLPHGAEPLSQRIDGPRVLKRALSQIGLVKTEDDGHILAQQLLPGQCLVTYSGALWRWDGLTISADAASSATTRLQQKNRLTELKDEIVQAAQNKEDAEKTLNDIKAERTQAFALATTARENLKQAQTTLNAAQDHYNELARAHAESASRLAALNEAITGRIQDQKTLQDSLDDMRSTLAQADDTLDLLEKLTEKKARLSEARNELSRHQGKLDAISHEVDIRRKRLDDINEEVEHWVERKQRADDRVQALAEREEKTRQTIAELESKPAEIERQRQGFLERISGAEDVHKHASDILAQEENINTVAQRELKAAETELADTRETRAMTLAAFNTAREHSDELVQIIQTKFECTPDNLVEKTELKADEEWPDIDKVQAKFDRLIRERDNMGPVNLCAEEEANTLSTDLEKMTTERDDLVAAINKLRGGIGQLNRQARERLLTAFETVDNHFQALFTRLFGGGKAHLSLIESDDPLDAGLEIFAQPPGKKLQVLSLLSGGEQTLTSIALIFAMFLTNPAPICVLDEIDAPLDDSNVDRVCTLLEEMARDGTTRFIIITHHRMTMARMDRLYGVTMSEKGVSQLVSVDLQQHELFDEITEAAAA